MDDAASVGRKPDTTEVIHIQRALQRGISVHLFPLQALGSGHTGVEDKVHQRKPLSYLSMGGLGYNLGAQIVSNPGCFRHETIMSRKKRNM